MFASIGVSPEKSKLTSLLRSSDAIVDAVTENMDAVMQRRGIVEFIINENLRVVRDRLQLLKIPDDAIFAEDVYSRLLEHIQYTDTRLGKFLGEPDTSTPAGCSAITQSALELVHPPKGFFLKREIAETLLAKNPPQHLLRLLGYADIVEAIRREGLFSLFSSVRFAERADWLNDIFFKAYKDLTPKDFEERDLEVIVLPERWREIGQQFVGKKLHHISHLKELGVVFVIPERPGTSSASLGELGEGYHISGGTLEIFTLVLHYLFEVPFYADLFRAYAQDPKTFTDKLTSALRGDVIGVLPQRTKSIQWRIIQRYLAKDNLSDPRLAEPHINPEAIHWAKAEEKLAELDLKHPDLGLGFWSGTGFAGDFFPLKEDPAEEVLLSFDLIDNMISLRRKTSAVSKYLYHQQEALWNKIFAAYVGSEEKMEEIIKENLYQGYIEL